MIILFLIIFIMRIKPEKVAEGYVRQCTDPGDVEKRFIDPQIGELHKFSVLLY